jgi:signal transduction histidine kinase
MSASAIRLTRRSGALQPTAAELASLAERLGFLRATRVGIALVVPLAAALFPRLRHVSLQTIAVVSLLYLAATAAPNLPGRLRRGTVILLVGVALLIDGVYLAWAMYVTGGAASPMRFLILAHVIAVTLLGSYRTGLKVAVWHTLLYFVVLYAEAAGLLAVREALAALPGNGDQFQQLAIFNLGALWAVTLGTAAFSAANERELRWQKVDLEQLSSMVEDIDRSSGPDEVPDLFLGRLCDVFGFGRGAVLASPDGDLQVMAYRGKGSAPEVDAGLDPLMQEAWTRGRTILVKELDPDVDPRLSSLVPDGRNVLVVPLMVDRDRRLGIAVLEQGGTGESIKRWVVTIVEQFASHTALALQGAWLLEEIDRQLQENRLLQAELQSQNTILETKVEERTHQLRESLQELRLVNEQRKRLLARLVNAQEEERRHVAEDIHDGPIQDIIVASMLLNELQSRATDPAGIETVSSVVDAIDRALDGLRGLLGQLRPQSLDQDGLESALRRHVDGLGGSFNVRIESRLRDEPPGDLALALFRISQEALANIRKHADADLVSIVLEERTDGYVVCIQDDGVGFSPPEVLQSAPGHLGLSSMRERAEMWSGWCRVQSLPDAGTTVEVWLPRRPRGGSGDDGVPAQNGGAPSPRSGGLTAVPLPVRHGDEVDEAFDSLQRRRAASGG